MTRIDGELTVRIPDDVAEALGIREGDDVDVTRPAVPTPEQIKSMNAEEVIQGLRKFSGRMPPNFKFDRDELHVR